VTTKPSRTPTKHPARTTPRHTLADVRRSIRTFADPARAALMARYFHATPGGYGDGDRFIGLTVPQVRTLARRYRDVALADLSRLLESVWHEERLFALIVMVAQYARGTATDRKRLFALYLRKRHRVNNWDLVDVSAPSIVGVHLHGQDTRRLDQLARSIRLWDRRIAMLATFHDIRQGQFVTALRIASALVDDDEDLIHKAVGWMLREIGNRDRAAEEAFLRRHPAMPRTMLRYAIEKFPEPLRQRYLKA